MSARPLAEWLAGFAHPRLALFVFLGAAVGVVGTGLLLLGVDERTTGLRLAVVGYIVFLFGASGYVAFTLFERAER